MWKCPSCETINNGEECVVCGYRHVDKSPAGTGAGGKRCRFCGTAMEMGARFCPVCGGDQIEDTKKDGKNVGTKILIALTILIIVACVGFVAFNLISSNSKAEFARDLSVAETYFTNRNYEDCIEKLDSMKSNANYKKSHEALLMEAKSYMELGIYDEAIVCFEKALEIGDSPEGYANLAVCYGRTGRTDKALEVLEKMPEREDIKHYIQGEIYAGEDNIDRAETEFRLAIDKAQEESLKQNAYISMAIMYKNKRHSDDESEKYYYLKKQIDIMQEAVRELKAEENLVLTELMGEAYYTGKQYDLAILKFNTLLEMGYDRDYIYRNLAVSYQRNEEYYEAERVLLEMKKLYPEDYTCYMQLAFLYMEMEGEKPLDQRDYSAVEENYELAKKYVGSNYTKEFMMLENSMEDLKRNGWIE